MFFPSGDPGTLWYKDLITFKFMTIKTDIQIQKDVMDELKWQPFLHASEIGVAFRVSGAA